MANHASVARIDAADRLCVPVPEGLPSEQAVFARLATVSMTTMRTTVAHGGDGVAVVGQGLIGNLAAQVFQACGARVNAFELSPAPARSGRGLRHPRRPPGRRRSRPTRGSTAWSSRRPARPRRSRPRSGWPRTAARS